MTLRKYLCRLDHNDRIKICLLLKEHPMRFSELQSALQISKSQLTYHLKKLTSSSLIEKNNNHSYQLTNQGLLIICSLFSDSLIDELLEWLKQNPQCLLPEDIAKFLWFDTEKHQILRSYYVLHDVLKFLEKKRPRSILVALDCPIWESDIAVQSLLLEMLANNDSRILLRNPPTQFKFIKPFHSRLRVTATTLLNFAFIVIDEEIVYISFYDRSYRLLSTLGFISTSSSLVDYCIAKFNEIYDTIPVFDPNSASLIPVPEDNESLQT